MAAGLFSQRKLNSIRKLLPELEKASWNSLLEFAPLSFLSKARGIPAYRDWGIYPGIFLWSLSTMGDRYFHKEHLESLREACRMQDSKVPTASKVLRSYNWLELFSLMSLRQKEKKKCVPISDIWLYTGVSCGLCWREKNSFILLMQNNQGWPLPLRIHLKLYHLTLWTVISIGKHVAEY